MEISGYGITIDLPDGWDGIIAASSQGLATMHAAKFALPPRDGEFASLAIAALPADGVLLVLTEYAPDVAGEGLFAHEGLPTPVPERAFRRRAFTGLQPGRYGVQRFCTASERPFCLYVVVGTQPDPAILVGEANAVLSTVSIQPRVRPGG
jgi:hypothetical protein